MKFLKNFRRHFDLSRDESEKVETLREVSANIHLTGTTIWILACAIIVASVGLNVNSTAVIIGAMLISPLMSPIVGVGFALGTHDFLLLRRSIINLFIATTISLIVSYFYFTVSPFKSTQPALLSRVSPTVYDVFIAFFGGLAGAIALTRAEKSNVIPGVAIATALMPPLCTAGWALSNKYYSYFLGAIYLYIINCFFIATATLFIVRILDYPLKTTLSLKHKKWSRIGYFILGLLIVIPSMLFAINLYRKQAFEEKADRFVKEYFIDKGFLPVHKKYSTERDSSLIELTFYGDVFRNQNEDELQKRLTSFGLANTKLIITQSLDVSMFKSSLLTEIKQNSLQFVEMYNQIENNRQKDMEDVKSEARVLFPSIGDIFVKENLGSNDTMSVFIELPIKNTPNERLEKWLKVKFNHEKVEFIYFRK